MPALCLALYCTWTVEWRSLVYLVLPRGQFAITSIVYKNEKMVAPDDETMKCRDQDQQRVDTGQNNIQCRGVVTTFFQVTHHFQSDQVKGADVVHVERT